MKGIECNDAAFSASKLANWIIVDILSYFYYAYVIKNVDKHLY